MNDLQNTVRLSVKRTIVKADANYLILSSEVQEAVCDLFMEIAKCAFLEMDAEEAVKKYIDNLTFDGSKFDEFNYFISNIMDKL